LTASRVSFSVFLGIGLLFLCFIILIKYIFHFSYFIYFQAKAPRRRPPSAIISPRDDVSTIFIFTIFACVVYRIRH
jgi:hypothetical protein